MTNPGQQFVQSILDQVGDRVKGGTEVSSSATDSATWDSSELVEWAANRAGAKMPDGSWRQYNQLNADGHAVDPEVALRTPGALLFKFSSDPKTGIPNERQVMISLGDGRVVDASGKQVAVIAAKPGEFTHAATVPAFALEPGEVANVRAMVAGRLGNPDGTPVQLAVPPVAERGGLTDDVVAIRKQAIDASQRAEEFRNRVSQGEEFKDALEDEAANLRRDAQTRLDNAATAADPTEASRLVKEAAELNATAVQIDARIQRTQKAIESERANSAAAQNEAAELFSRSNAAIDARMPAVAIRGNSAADDVTIVEVPAPPDKGASIEDLRSWVAERELAESSREQAAAQKFRSSSQLDDIAELKTTLAADARTRAAAMTSVIDAEQTRLVALEERLSTARQQADHFFDEMSEQQQQFEDLTARGDPAAASASARVDELMRQQASWRAQASNLEERVKVARDQVGRAAADRTDFEQVAASLTEEATRARDLAVKERQQANDLQAESDRLDRETDVVETAISRGVATHLVIDGENVHIDIDIPGRSPSDLTPDEIDDLDLPGSPSEPPAGERAPADGSSDSATDGTLLSTTDMAADPVAVGVTGGLDHAPPESSLESEVLDADLLASDPQLIEESTDAPDVATLADVSADALSDLATEAEQFGTTDAALASGPGSFDEHDGAEPDFDDDLMA